MTLKFGDRAADEWAALVKSVRLVEGPLGPIAKGQHLDVSDAEVVSTNQQALGAANGLKHPIDASRNEGSIYRGRKTPLPSIQHHPLRKH
jgi:hypothetical protein